jgi:hypothetical protein
MIVVLARGSSAALGGNEWLMKVEGIPEFGEKPPGIQDGYNNSMGVRAKQLRVGAAPSLTLIALLGPR